MGRCIDRLIAHQVTDALERAQVPPDQILNHMIERMDLLETFLGN